MRTGWISLIFATVLVALGAPGVAQGAKPTPTPSPSPQPTDNPSINYLAVVPPVVWYVLLGIVVLVVGLVLYGLISKPRIALADRREPTDKDLESLRIYYGFWLINGALAMVLAVAVIAVLYKASGNVTSSDVIALVTSVTAVVGTLIAAFFGVQAAGAGRSQAMDKLGSQNQSTLRAKLDPDNGPLSVATPVKITGNGFTGASGVNFGTSAGTAFTADNDGLITVTSPVGAQKGTVDVVVVFPGATPPNVNVGQFRYT
jgi:hypothetical protein